MAHKFDEPTLMRWSRLYVAATRNYRAVISAQAALELGCSERTFHRHVIRPGAAGIQQNSVTGRHWAKMAAHNLADMFVEEWLSPTQPTIVQKFNDYCDACEGHDPPIAPLSESSFRRKIAKIPAKVLFERRGEACFENVQFGTIKGHSPRRTMPLEAVQIDHTQLDTDVIDRFGSILGRPWFTAIIDEYTRGLLGFYLSLLPPQRFTVGMAIARAIFPKDEWLASLGVEGQWDMFGVPMQIGSDNGADLTAKETTDAYAALGIPTIDYRPIGEPQYGAIIERFMGTVAYLAKGIPGYTGANWKEKPAGKSPPRPCFTMKDLEPDPKLS